MKIRVIVAFCLGLVLALGACFDSLIDDPCRSGYTWSKTGCVSQALTDAGAERDGAIVPPGDGDPDAGATGDGSIHPDGGPRDGGPGSDGGPVTDGGPLVDGGPGSDGGPLVDAGPDASPDGAVDAAPDASPDAAVDAAPDAAPDAAVDAAPDALVCALPTVECRGLCVDTMTDPDNCGGCGHVCASGVCTAGVCAGELRGHIVAIGHDYRSHHSAMARVLGNSVALGAHFDVGIARLRGTAAAAAVSGTSNAISTSMSALGRPWHSVTLPASPSSGALTGVDVFVVDAQLGDGAAAEALGASWLGELTSFLARGGVVIVLEGGGGVGYRFAIGAGLYTITAPIDATGLLAVVSDGADATTQQVASPYLAETTSVTLPGTQHAAISALTGGTLVFHFTR